MANQEATHAFDGCSKDENVEVVYGKNRNDKIRNEHFLEHLGVASIEDKFRETHLR